MNTSQIIMYGFTAIFFLLTLVNLIKVKFEFHRMFRDEDGDPQMVQFMSMMMYIPLVHLIANAGSDPSVRYLIMTGIIGSFVFFPELTRDLFNRLVRMWIKMKGKGNEK